MNVPENFFFFGEGRDNEQEMIPEVVVYISLPVC